jgi:hypothetical protein
MHNATRDAVRFARKAKAWARARLTRKKRKALQDQPQRLLQMLFFATD